jgi:hypothetical protein
MAKLALAAVAAAVLALPGAAGAAGAQAQGGGGGGEWSEVSGAGQGRGFVDKASIRLEGGKLSYRGRTLLPKPDAQGVVEIVHQGEIDCRAKTFRILVLELFGPGGAKMGAFPMPAEEPAIPIPEGSSNGTLHAEHCR